jgi:hypothetical protein
VRWLAVTLALLGASAVLVAGIYLRDRDPSNWLPAPRTAASSDAGAVMAGLGGPDCGRRCSFRLLGNPKPDHWLAQIVDRARTECVDINLRAFGASDTNGLSGVALIDCESLAPADG